jgi:hypothetical protein
MTDLEKAARQALDALERTVQHKYPDQRDPAFKLGQIAIEALRAALAQQQAEPVAMDKLIQIAWKMGFDAAKAEQAEPVAVQAEPVVEPPKSFRVGYMTGYADGQRELREKQQTEPLVGNSVMPPGGDAGSPII